MKSNVQRLNNISGQIEGVKKMMAEGKDCLAILTQLKAIRSAVGGVMDLVMEEQIDTCMESLKEKDKKLLIKMKDYVKHN